MHLQLMHLFVIVTAFPPIFEFWIKYYGVKCIVLPHDFSEVYYCYVMILNLVSESSLWTLTHAQRHIVIDDSWGVKGEMRLWGG